MGCCKCSLLIYSSVSGVCSMSDCTGRITAGPLCVLCVREIEGLLSVGGWRSGVLCQQPFGSPSLQLLLPLPGRDPCHVIVSSTNSLRGARPHTGGCAAMHTLYGLNITCCGTVGETRVSHFCEVEEMMSELVFCASIFFCFS